MPTIHFIHLNRSHKSEPIICSGAAYSQTHIGSGAHAQIWSFIKTNEWEYYWLNTAPTYDIHWPPAWRTAFELGATTAVIATVVRPTTMHSLSGTANRHRCRRRRRPIGGRSFGWSLGWSSCHPCDVWRVSGSANWFLLFCCVRFIVEHV